MWPLSILSARPGKENGAARKLLHWGRLPHRNSKGTAFRLFLYIRVFSCVMNTRHGAGGGTRTRTPSLAMDFEFSHPRRIYRPQGEVRGTCHPPQSLAIQHFSAFQGVKPLLLLAFQRLTIWRAQKARWRDIGGTSTQNLVASNIKKVRTSAACICC